MLVRYGRMGAVGWFEHNETSIPRMPTRIVVRTEKGLELGSVVGQLGCYKEGGQLKINEDQVSKYFNDSAVDFPEKPVGRVIRYATADDVSEERHLREIVKEEMECCRRFAEEMEVPMKVVDAEHIFGGERIIFYFMSDGRVDFRELVKRLAHEYQTRIEMRQVGSRDEAKLLGDVESCGQTCCCIRFLRNLKPVNMRMAKMQKATLDPSKISGYCGRLKCCLRYEDKAYTELKKRLPKRNVRVKTSRGEGRVVDSQILTQLVVVEYEGGKKEAVGVDELEIVAVPDVKKNAREDVDEKQDSTDVNRGQDDTKADANKGIENNEDKEQS